MDRKREGQNDSFLTENKEARFCVGESAPTFKDVSPFGIPTGPASCELDIRVRAEPGAVLPPEGLQQLLQVLRDEDGFAVEQIQRVIRSPRFEVGPLASTHEAPITAFQRDVLAHLG